jgi:hypothetical protein
LSSLVLQAVPANPIRASLHIITIEREPFRRPALSSASPDRVEVVLLEIMSDLSA